MITEFDREDDKDFLFDYLRDPARLVLHVCGTPRLIDAVIHEHGQDSYELAMNDFYEMESIRSSDLKELKMVAMAIVSMGGWT